MGPAKVSDFVTTARKVVMKKYNRYLDDTWTVPNNMALTDDRTWMSMAGAMDNDIYMPLTWIQESRVIREYTDRLVDLKMKPEYHVFDG